MTDQNDTPSVAGPGGAAPTSARSPSHRPSPSQRATTQRRPPPNIAGPTNNSYTPPPNPTRRNTAGEVVSEDQIEKKGDSGKAAAVWGVGGVFPQREEKRGMPKKEKEKHDDEREEGKRVSAPTETDWPASEREDPFSSSPSSPPPHHNEVDSPTSVESNPHSESSTVCEEQPRQKEGESSGGDEDQDQGQVGGELPQDGEWEDEMEKQDGDPPVHTWWGSVRFALREPLAEFLGMLLVIALGTGANCQVKISQDSAGTYSNMNFVWGMAVMVGIYVAGGISGGHLNPSVTISLAVFRGFPWRMVPRYLIAQVLGAFCGALIIYANYKTALGMYDPDKLIYSSTGQNTSASLFVTMPNQQAGGTVQGFFQEILASAVLSVVVLALGDENNAPPGAGLGALILGLVVISIGMSMGWISSYAINPARDFGPRLALWALGYGKLLWTHDQWWWLVGPIAGTTVGSLIGCLAYDICIFVGAGSPVNSSANELKHAIGLPILHNMVRQAIHRDGNSTRAQAKREAVVEEGGGGFGAEARRRKEGAEAEDTVRRWTVARKKMKKAEEENRDRRRRRVEEIVREKERGQKTGRKLSTA
ncbi:aquaporin-like protein [Leucosporidium creatinivorum]|uniref:Aquaporin-like protein n=1 Tax=Leucosporidium creatinivorum TaxID=106004 RepID=A0A1Y2ENG8_9BASI|nr:aquaporin-like protein [Leucosporidium creatinivorum]